MKVTMDCVSALAELLNVASSSERFDWPEVERGLSVALPDDYKNIVETFPAGFFQGVIRLIRPGDHRKPRTTYLGRYANRLEDMRRWRESDPDRFPWPIYPESKGILPWGRSRREDLFFWLTGAENPNDWPLVLVDREFESWELVEATLCSFLLSVTQGRFDVDKFSYESTRREPWFDISLPVRGSPPVAGEQFWASPGRQVVAGQANQFEFLVELLASSPRSGRSLTWGSIEEKLGSRLPSDYKSFIEAFGPGTICDLTVTSPDAGGKFDLFNLIEDKARLVADHPMRGIMVPPLHPEPGGIIPWGYLNDNWCCGWVPLGRDPETWGTVAVPPPMLGYTFEPGLSFSAFIVKYLTEPEFGSFQGREVQLTTPALFSPQHK